MAKAIAAPTPRRVKDFTPLAESASGALRSQKTAEGRRAYKGVTLIKAGLGNQRDRNYYPATTLESAVRSGMFQGLRAYADHQDSLSEEVQPERTVRDMVGVYKNPRFVREGRDGGRVVADLHVFRSAKWLSDTVDDLIDLGLSDKIGLSINGRGRTVEKAMPLEEAGGESVNVNWVEDFLVLRSADVVTEAGAGGGFQQLLESARGSAQSREKAMKLTKEQMAALKEAIESDDPDVVAAALRECGCMAAEKDAKAGKAAKTKEAKGKAAKASAAAVADEEVEEVEADEDEVDPDEELDRVTEEVKEGSDDEDTEGEEAEAADEDEDLEEADEEDEDAVEDEDGEAETRENARMGYIKKGAGVLVKGKSGGKYGSRIKGPKETKGSFTTKAGQNTRQKGRRYAEADAEVRRLQQQLDALKETNTRLSAQLKVRTTADRARNLLRESSIPEKLRPEVLRLMVGKSEDEMRRVIRYHERMISTAIEESGGYVEGAGTSFRESHHGGKESPLGESFLSEIGLPVKD